MVPCEQPRTQKQLLACNGSSNQDGQLTALLLVATAAKGAAQEPMPPHGVGPWSQQDLSVYASNHPVMPCTVDLSRPNKMK